MNTYDFTARVRKVLQLAREEAVRRHHRYVGTEHVLLAIIAEGQGVAAAALKQLDLSFDVLRSAINARVPPGNKHSLGADFPYDAAAKKMFELSMVEARELSHSFIGTEHLLLGIMREGKGVGALVLSESGATLAAARKEIRLLSGEGFDEIT